MLLKLAILFSIAARSFSLDQTSPESPTVDLKQLPPFRDEFLSVPEYIRQGQKFVQHLGRINVLDTLLSPKEPAKMQTKLAIINRHRVTNITFHPNLCSDGSEAPDCPFVYNLPTLLESRFDVTSKTIIFIPGYRSDDSEPWIEEATNLWLQLEQNVDVIQVGWAHSNKGLYTSAVAHTPSLARQISILLYYLAKLGGKNLDEDEFLSNIHLVGHSLGAQTAGFVGQDLGGKIGRITGLDPAGPSYDLFPTKHRLDPSDARLVQVMYTNMGKLKYFNAISCSPLSAICSIPGMDTIGDALGTEYDGEGDTAWYGCNQHLGHINFYANNGRVQPGCSGLLHLCDHNRAYEIYIEMLRFSVDLSDQLHVHFQHQNLSDDLKEEILKSGRIHGFQADDYDSFVSGKALSMSNNKLMAFANDQEAVDDLQRTRAFNETSIPFDLNSPVEELIEELKLYHNISIDNETPGLQKYFFLTLDKKPFVGDHFLIKLKVETEKSFWRDEACSLTTIIEGHVSNKLNETVTEVRKLSELIASGYHIGVPFVHPSGPATRVLDVKWHEKLKELPGNARGYLDERLEMEFRQLLPTKITLMITRPKTQSFVGVFSNSIKKWVKSDSFEECGLIITSVEVQLLGKVRESDFGKVVGAYRDVRNHDGDRLRYHNLNAYKYDVLKQNLEEGMMASLTGNEQDFLALTLGSIVINPDRSQTDGPRH